MRLAISNTWHPIALAGNDRLIASGRAALPFRAAFAGAWARLHT